MVQNHLGIVLFSVIRVEHQKQVLKAVKRGQKIDNTKFYLLHLCSAKNKLYLGGVKINVRPSHIQVPCQKCRAKLAKSRKFAFPLGMPPLLFHLTTMNRTVLGQIDENLPRRHELTPYQRGIIIGQPTCGVLPTAIGKALNLPRTTVQGVIERATRQDNGVNNPRSGRPTIVTDRARRVIIRNARINPKITYLQLRACIDTEFSKSTMYRVLKEAGITNWLAKKRPLLRLQDVAARWAWAKKYKDWTYSDWAKIIWSDECSVERGSGYRREWCFSYTVSEME